MKPFENILKWSCGCVGVDTCDGPGATFILQPCQSHPHAGWHSMIGEVSFPADAGVALCALNETMMLLEDGVKFRKMKKLLLAE